MPGVLMNFGHFLNLHLAGVTDRKLTMSRIGQQPVSIPEGV